jgi:glycosyltransferase involved in cell wall biosynthesis
MRIVFLGKRFYTNQDALEQRFGRVYWLPQKWHEDQHHVELVLLDYHSLRTKVCADGSFVPRSLPAFDPRTLVEVTSMVRSVRPDVIVASGDCFLGLLGLWLARRIDARFVFDVYDDYRVFGAYRAFVGWDAFGFVCRRADLVIYASVAMSEEHAFGNPCVVVPNGVDDTLFRPKSMTEAREGLRLPQAGRLVGYFGSMTPEHGVSGLIKAVQKLRARQVDVSLLLCGKEHPCTPVSGDGVLYRGMVPNDTIPDYLNACDVLALPYLNGAFLDKASSCKIAEYLYCRRPIVATRTPNFVQNFPKQAAELDSLLAAPGDVNMLAQSIQRQLDQPIIAEPPADMTWSQIAAGLIPKLQQLLGPGGSSA